MKLIFLVALVGALPTLGAAQGSSSPPTWKPPVWKEYVYQENGFAITLPSDPHPHKSGQMQNGTAYSVPLPYGGFTLSTMEANEKCLEAVRSQSATWEKTKNSPPEGFKVISFREVEGAGYTGVEFFQQVPTGAKDYERWICGAHRLYVLVAQWGRDKSEPEELRRIVDSFRILTK